MLYLNRCKGNIISMEMVQKEAYCSYGVYTCSHIDDNYYNSGSSKCESPVFIAKNLPALHIICICYYMFAVHIRIDVMYMHIPLLIMVNNSI